jgi:signal transduction histidine kinase
MRSDVDFHSPSDAGFRFSKTWFWRWALGGVAAVLLLAGMSSPAWVYALVVVAWCIAGAVWFQSDAVAILRQITTASTRSRAEASQDAPAWQNWLDGWYWETDAQDHLILLKPSASDPAGLQVDWRALSDYLDRKPAWLSAWRADMSAHADWGRMVFGLTQKLAWNEAIELPLPDVWTPGLLRVEGTWRCRLRGEPRWDEQGRYLGFRGVMQFVPPAPAPSSAPADVPGQSALQAAEDAQHAQMREAEQEGLRYALSHDLRAPLRVVEGFTRIVKEDYGRLLDKLGHDHLDRVLTAAARMNGMIDAILAQAQLAAEPLQRLPVDLSTLAREIGAEQVAAAVSAGAPPVQLTVAEGMQVEADPLLVRRVMENLISNALKYSAKVATPCVEVGVMPATNPAVFYVRDNGAGFDMQHADKLFGMFQRLHSAKEFPGNGVGLAGVQNIVRRHGGRIWAEAQPGQGACFYFTLMGTVEAQQRASRSQ